MNLNSKVINIIIVIIIIIILCTGILYINDTKSEASDNNIQLPISNYNAITSRFGPRINPVTKKQSNHSGVDFSNIEGTKLISVANGKVVFSGFRGAFGYTIMIKDNITDYTYLYGHVDPKNMPKVGTYVQKGQVISKIGPKYVENSSIKDASGRGINGYTTGPHLHFSLLDKNSNFIDPSIVLGDVVK